MKYISYYYIEIAIYFFLLIIILYHLISVGSTLWSRAQPGPVSNYGKSMLKTTNMMDDSPLQKVFI